MIPGGGGPTILASCSVDSRHHFRAGTQLTLRTSGPASQAAVCNLLASGQDGAEQRREVTFGEGREGFGRPGRRQPGLLSSGA